MKKTQRKITEVKQKAYMRVDDIRDYLNLIKDSYERIASEGLETFQTIREDALTLTKTVGARVDDRFSDIARKLDKYIFETRAVHEQRINILEENQRTILRFFNLAIMDAKKKQGRKKA